MRFGANKKLFEKLKERGITFKRLAEMLDNEFTPQTLFHYADGRKVPGKAVKMKIANKLGCLVGDIF